MGSAIAIDDVSKHFKLNHARADSLKERVVNFRKANYEEFWALKDVTIHVDQGETLDREPAGGPDAAEQVDVATALVSEVEVLPHDHGPGGQAPDQHLVDELLGRLGGPVLVEADHVGGIDAVGRQELELLVQVAQQLGS